MSWYSWIRFFLVSRTVRAQVHSTLSQSVKIYAYCRQCDGILSGQNTTHRNGSSFTVYCEGTTYFFDIRGDADKSLALPGRKQATATKLVIYSTYPPRSSINFLASCSKYCKPGGKITTFKLGHPVFDGGARFLNVCQNGVNFLRRLALQEKKIDDNSRLDVVEIARVAWHASFQASVTRKDLQFGIWTGPSFQRQYRFRHTISGSNSS